MMHCCCKDNIMLLKFSKKDFMLIFFSFDFFFFSKKEAALALVSSWASSEFWLISEMIKDVVKVVHVICSTAKRFLAFVVRLPNK